MIDRVPTYLEALRDLYVHGLIDAEEFEQSCERLIREGVEDRCLSGGSGTVPLRLRESTERKLKDLALHGP